MATLDRPDGSQSAARPTPGGDATTAGAAPSVAAAPAEIDRELFALYFGPNAAPFLATLDKMYAANPSLKRAVRSWSWPAFLVTVPWFLYRKRWLEAVTFTLLPIVFFYFFPKASSAGIGLALVAGMQAKAWYVMAAAGRIRSILREETDPHRAREKIARAGGVSIPGAIIGGVMLLGAVAGVLMPLLR